MVLETTINFFTSFQQKVFFRIFISFRTSLLALFFTTLFIIVFCDFQLSSFITFLPYVCGHPSPPSCLFSISLHQTLRLSSSTTFPVVNHLISSMINMFLYTFASHILIRSANLQQTEFLRSTCQWKLLVLNISVSFLGSLQ